jgi:hypothetical protein
MLKATKVSKSQTFTNRLNDVEIPIKHVKYLNRNYIFVFDTIDDRDIFIDKIFYDVSKDSGIYMRSHDLYENKSKNWTFDNVTISVPKDDAIFIHQQIRKIDMFLMQMNLEKDEDNLVY